MPLTDAACRAAQCPAGSKFKRFADAGGLYLEVTQVGSKYWRLKYRHEGKEKRLALGVYPAVSLATARRERDKAKRQLADGVDPSGAKQRAKSTAQANAATAFATIARKWWNDWKADKTERHARYVLARLESDAFPEIGTRPIGELTAPEFVRMAKRIEAKGAADLPRRVLETTAQVMRYAVAHGYADRNPVADVKPGDVLRPHKVENHARLATAELPGLMRKIAVYDGSPYTRMALALMALTFVRTSELIEARWEEFDLERAEWRIPAERMKMRRMHVVPLSRQAVEVLELLRAHRGVERCVGTAYLFPGERDHSRPMSNNTILYALYRMGYRGRMTGHGFRGIASTCLNEMGYRADVIEAQLAHQEGNKIRAAYNHAQYMDERVPMMQAWADYLEAAQRSGKVIPFKQARVVAA